MKKDRDPLSVTLLIVICTAIRCILSIVLNLGNDEVYYFTYAVQPDWNHFDHPPLLGLFIRLSTLNLQWVNDFSMRFPAIAGAAINTWLIAKCGENLGNKQTGFFAAVLYNTSIYTSIISGLFILPDSVQVVFWLAAIYVMLLIGDEQTDSRRNKLLVVLGLWIGLAMMCKVHGIFLWVGFVGFVIFNRPIWLRNPHLYISVALTVVIISPIFLWNVHNHFISWTFHSERVTIKPAIDWVSFFRTTLGQIAYQNPVNFAIFILAGIYVSKNRLGNFRPKIRLLLWLSIPIILCTTLVSLFRSTLPHWSGPGFITLNLIGAWFLSAEKSTINIAGKRLLNTSAILMTTVLISGTILVKLYPGALNDTAEPQTGAGDATLDLTGWRNLGQEFKKIRDRDIRKGSMLANVPIITNKWFPGGHIFYYVAWPLKMDMIGAGQLNDLHKFKWLNNLYTPIASGTNAYYITPSNYFADLNTLYGDQFKKIELAAKIPNYRNGKIARYWYIYRLKFALTALPDGHEAAVLPTAIRITKAQH